VYSSLYIRGCLPRRQVTQRSSHVGPWDRAGPPSPATVLSIPSAGPSSTARATLSIRGNTLPASPAIGCPGSAYATSTPGESCITFADSLFSKPVLVSEYSYCFCDFFRIVTDIIPPGDRTKTSGRASSLRRLTPKDTYGRHGCQRELLAPDAGKSGCVRCALDLRAICGTSSLVALVCLGW
jgi:hypothetical protein